MSASGISIKTIATNFLLFLISVCVSALLLEQGFRIWLFGSQAFSIDALRNNVPVNNAGIMRQSPFDDIYWALQPDLDVSFKLARLTTNHDGLADRAYTLEKPAGVTRIAVLGDSYSMASGVDTDRSYHALIEQQLQQQGNKIEIINFAVGGYGLERYNAVLQHIVPAWHPDAILLGYCAFNDHFALPPSTGSVPPFHPFRDNGFLTSYVLAYFDMRERANKEIPTPLGEAQFSFIDRELARTRTLADQIHSHMPILLAYLDNRPHPPADITRIQQMAQQHGMVFVDTTVDFANTRIDDVSIQLLDSHPNALAHERFAQRLLPAVQALLQQTQPGQAL